MNNGWQWVTSTSSKLIFAVLSFWAIFFFPVISGNQLYFLDDLKEIYYPLEHEYATAFNDWRLPLWNNEFGFGQPLLAWSQLGFFAPVHIMLRLLHLHPLVLLQASTIIHFLIGSAGALLLLRHLKLPPAAALLGSILFSANGFAVGHLVHINFITSLMWLPWLLLTSLRLIQKPTIPNLLLLTAAATATTISGQPQIVLYLFLAAILFSLIMAWHTYPLRQIAAHKKTITRLMLATLLAAGLTFGLSSFSILPLYEFLPETERSHGIAREQLVEFSYPPSHAITLIAPYYYGTYNNYWGAKSFVELSAFTGIIPLLLASSTLATWQRHKSLRLTGWAFVAIAILFSLGKYSPLYNFLVEQEYLSSLSVPSRFILFFQMGILLLSSLGIDDLLRLDPKNRTRVGKTALCALAFPLLLLTPFLINLATNSFAEPGRPPHPHLVSWLLLATGIIVFGFFLTTKKHRGFAGWLTAGAAVMTLLVFGWQYTPTTAAKAALQPSPFTDNLLAYKEQTGLPARLYSRPNLYPPQTADTKELSTDEFSPQFTVLQELPTTSSTSCFILPLHAKSDVQTAITISLHQALNTPALEQRTIQASAIRSQPNQEVCFSRLEKDIKDIRYLKLTSPAERSGINAYYTKNESAEADIYMVRIKNPTTAQLEQSQKQGTLVITQQDSAAFDIGSQLLSRHLNITADSSSARWIGALSIRPYREYIETFFASDSNLMDGENTHALIRHRDQVNAAGITHLATDIPVTDKDNDPLLGAGFTLVAEKEMGSNLLRLYENPDAYPKAYLVPAGELKPADDEVRYELLQPDHNPRQKVYLDGPAPPQDIPNGSRLTNAAAHIIHYDSTQKDIRVTTDQPAVLVVTDSSTPQWHTFIDEQPAPYLTANSFFKTAIVPAGEHTVSFRYHSPAIQQSKQLALVSTVTLLILIIWQFVRPQTRKTQAPTRPLP